MFSYYGSKSKIIKNYPEPEYPLIIEPFAGSARYSLRYCDKQCWINDSYKVITDLWEWIITANSDNIEAIPNLLRGDDCRKCNVSPVIRNLLGFCVRQGCEFPQNIVSPWSAQCGRIGQQKRKLLKYCEKLLHWKITNLDYQQIPNQQATWFIDPPYQNPIGRKRYKHHKIDYDALADWCKNRQGQVIVCENEGANWLPFKPLVSFRGQGSHRRMEMIWENKTIS